MFVFKGLNRDTLFGMSSQLNSNSHSHSHTSALITTEVWVKSAVCFWGHSVVSWKIKQKPNVITSTTQHECVYPNSTKMLTSVSNLVNIWVKGSWVKGNWTVALFSVHTVHVLHICHYHSVNKSYSILSSKSTQPQTPHAQPSSDAKMWRQTKKKWWPCRHVETGRSRNLSLGCFYFQCQSYSYHGFYSEAAARTQRKKQNRQSSSVFAGAETRLMS